MKIPKLHLLKVPKGKLHYNPVIDYILFDKELIIATNTYMLVAIDKKYLFGLENGYENISDRKILMRKSEWKKLIKKYDKLVIQENGIKIIKVKEDKDTNELYNENKLAVFSDKNPDLYFNWKKLVPKFPEQVYLSNGPKNSVVVVNSNYLQLLHEILGPISDYGYLSIYHTKGFNEGGMIYIKPTYNEEIFNNKSFAIIKTMEL